MPIDAAIPLQVRPPQTPINPLADVAQIMALKQAQQLLPLKIQEAQQNQQEGALRLQQTQQAINDQKSSDAAWKGALTVGDDGKPTVDRAKLTQLLPGHLVPQANETLDKLDTSRETLLKLKNDNAKATAEHGAGIGQFLQDSQYAPGAYRTILPIEVANGVTTPQVAQQLLQQLAAADQQDPTGAASKALIKQHADQLLSQAPADYVTAQARKAAATTGATREAREADIAPLQKTKLEQETTGTQPITPYQQAQLDSKNDPAERNPTEASLAMQVAAGRVPGASVDAVRASQQAELALKRLDQSRLNSRPVTIPPASVPLNPMQQSIAHKLATGDFNPAQLTRFPDKESLIAGAISENPDWSPQTYATKKAFEDPQSKQSQNLGTISRIVGHIGRFEQNSKDLGVSPSLLLGVNLTGKAAATQEDAHAIAAELEKLVSGGVGTEGQVQSWTKALTSTRPDIRQQAVDEISKLIGSQYEGMSQTYKTTIGTDLPVGKYVSPAGLRWMKAKGIDAGGTSPAAVPGVGSQFNGQKVLKVEKVQ